MKLIISAFSLAAMCAVGLGAQSGTTTTKTKVEVKDGKEIKVGGCLERNPSGGYLLTTTSGSMKYVVVTDEACVWLARHSPRMPSAGGFNETHH